MQITRTMQCLQIVDQLHSDLDHRLQRELILILVLQKLVDVGPISLHDDVCEICRALAMVNNLCNSVLILKKI